MAVHCQESTNGATSWSYDVDYVVGGSEKGVDDEFVSNFLAIENPAEHTPNAKQIHSTVDNPDHAHRPRAKGAQSKTLTDVHPSKPPPNPNNANRPRASGISTGALQSKDRADVHPSPTPPPNPNDAHRPRGTGAQSKNRADVQPPQPLPNPKDAKRPSATGIPTGTAQSMVCVDVLPPKPKSDPNDAHRPRTTGISNGTAQSMVCADVHPPKPPLNPNDANRRSAKGISNGTAQSMVCTDVHPPKPLPDPNHADRPSATGISTGTAQSIVRSNVHPPPKPPPTEPKNYWRCHECGDLVSPATHCTTCRRPHKHQRYDEEEEQRPHALAIKKSFHAQVTRNALRRGRDFWMCSHCNIGIPSLSMPCGMCRRRFSRAVLEGKEFDDFIQMRREQERKRREKVKYHYIHGELTK